MEILRFEQVPESAPKRKKSSRGFLALGLVAALFGISTAFASSTIQINNDQAITLGQGVTVLATCDNFIGVNPTTELKTNLTSFQLKNIIIGYDYLGNHAAGSGDDYTIDSSNHDSNTGEHCGMVDFAIKFYDSTDNNLNTDKTIPLTCNQILGVTNSNTGYLYNNTDSLKALSHYLDIDNVTVYGGQSFFKCDDSALYFRDQAQTHTIEFLLNRTPDFFDHISVETSPTVSYLALTPGV